MWETFNREVARKCFLSVTCVGGCFSPCNKTLFTVLLDVEYARINHWRKGRIHFVMTVLQKWFFNYY